MQGEYRGDFTRDTFYRANHFCRVLMQQGRVQLDADWNEQGAILLYFLRSLARDLIGRHGGPRLLPAGNAPGFAVQQNPGPPVDLTIGPGHYYVDGILCELEAPPANPNGQLGPGASYLTQAAYPNPPAVPITANGLVYLDVWERHLVSAQQDAIREVALGGPDTASRAQVVWQVKLATELPSGNLGWPPSSPAQAVKFFDATWALWTGAWQPANRGLLQARVVPQQTSTDPCVISPRSAYRGTENQLYRVEIQTGGLATAATPATFKWSRENGSVVFPILSLATGSGQTTVTLASLGRDSRLSLEVNDWVEVVDDVSSLAGVPRPLLQVQALDRAAMTATLGGTVAITVDQTLANHPLLRRWDHRAGDPAQGGLQIQADGAALVAEGGWLNLEDGVQVQFQLGAMYRSGDYWLIPARVATGNVEWPQQADSQGNVAPQALPPHGIEHHYAPLGYFTPGLPSIVDLRRAFGPLAT